MTARCTVASLLCGAALLCAGAALAVLAPPEPTTPPVLVHPDLPEVLTGPWLDRLDLFPEIDGLARVRFGVAPWGGVVARLEVDTPDGRLRVLVRNLSGQTWRELQERVRRVLAGEEFDEPVAPLPTQPAPLVIPEDVAGADTTVVLADTTGALDIAPAPADTAVAPTVRAWPEVAAPPAALPREERLPPGMVGVRGRWLALVEAGPKWNVSGFNAFFTPGVALGLAFGHGITERTVALLGFNAGFGDMRGEFEDAFGDGRTNTFGFDLTGLLRLPVTGTQDLYAQAGAGYHIRSLYWGGAFLDPVTGRVVEGRVLEQQDFGLVFRVGWMWRRDHPDRPRFWDIGLGLQTSPADQWVFWTEDAFFEASGRDLWLQLTVRFWDGL